MTGCAVDQDIDCQVRAKDAAGNRSLLGSLPAPLNTSVETLPPRPDPDLLKRTLVKALERRKR